MTISLLFWIIFIISFLFGGYSNRASLRAWATGDLVIWILIGILGWAVFGAAVHK